RTREACRAGSAWAEAAAEPRSVQVEVIAQDVEEWSRAVDVDGVRLPVDLEGESSHDEAECKTPNSQLPTAKSEPRRTRRTRRPRSQLMAVGAKIRPMKA